MTITNEPAQDDPSGSPEGARPAGRGYWFTPLPTYLLDAVYDPGSPVNAPAAMLWAHIHRHYAWRERIFPSFARLAEETGQGERTVRRLMQALKDVGAITWGATFSSKGRSSNEYALAPARPFEFDRDPSEAVAAKSGRHSEVAAKSDRNPPVKSDRHPPAKNGRVIESSSYLESTEEEPPSSVPPSPPAAAEPAPDGGGGGGCANNEQHAEAAGFLRSLPGSWAAGRRTAEQLAPLLLAAITDGGWELDGQLAAKLTENPVGVRNFAAVLRSRIEDLPQRTRPQAPATGHRPFQCPPDSVYALGFDGQPLPAQPAWCGDPDCDEITRTRDVELPDGLRASAPCRQCHPEAVAAVGQPLPGTDATVAGWAQVAAQLATGPLPGTDTKVAGWLALPTGG